MMDVRKDALDIYEGGACNARAIVRTMTEAADTATDRVGNGTEAMRRSPEWAPFRLMLAQLAFLAGQGIGDYPGVDEDQSRLRAETEA